jgi:hypothetical protein
MCTSSGKTATIRYTVLEVCNFACLRGGLCDTGNDFQAKPQILGLLLCLCMAALTPVFVVNLEILHNRNRSAGVHAGAPDFGELRARPRMTLW